MIVSGWQCVFFACSAIVVHIRLVILFYAIDPSPCLFLAIVRIWDSYLVALNSGEIFPICRYSRQAELLKIYNGRSRYLIVGMMWIGCMSVFGDNCGSYYIGVAGS